MCFWSWGRELEDKFDDANTQKLSRVIVKPSQSQPVEHALPSSPEMGHSSGEIELSTMLGSQYDEPASKHHSEYLKDSDLYLKRPDGDMMKLERIPVMAVFHRNDAAGKGVPHSFASFLQRYPALPQVVVRHLAKYRLSHEICTHERHQIFLNTRLVAMPHVPIEDRYTVSKVRSIQGFFAVTMRSVPFFYGA